MYKLKVENYAVIGSDEYDLSSGLTAILGPNGTGKSTIVEALYLAFTGDIIDGRSMTDRISWGCDKAVVELQTPTFVVRRTITQTVNKHYLKHGDIELTKKQEITDFICKLYNLADLSILLEVPFAAQYKAVDILESTPSKRIEMLASVFGLSKYEKLRDALATVGKTLPVYADDDTLYSMVKNTIDTSSEQIKQLTLVVNELLGKKLPTKDEVTIEDIQALDRKRLVHEREDAIAQEAQLREQITSISEKAAALASSINESHAKLALRQQAETYNNLKSTLNDLKLRLASTDKSFIASDKIQASITSLQTHKGSLEVKLAQIRENAKLLAGGVCPLSKGVPCATLLATHDPTNLAKDEAEVVHNIATLDLDITMCMQAISESKDAESTINSLETQIHSITESMSHTPPEVINFDMSVPIVAVDDTQKELKELNDQLAGLYATKASFDIIINECATHGVTTEEERASLRAKYDADTVIKNDLQRNNDLLYSAEVALDNANKQLAEIEATRELSRKNNLMKEVMETLRMAFHRERLPQLLLNKVIDQLNDRLNHYVDVFNFKYGLKVSSEGEFIYNTYTDGWRDVANLSGGQKYIVSILLRFSFKDILKASFPLMVLDEPTTGMDEQNRALLSSLFSDLMNRPESRDLYLIVPTHDKDIIEVSAGTIQL